MILFFHEIASDRGSQRENLTYTIHVVWGASLFLFQKIKSNETKSNIAHTKIKMHGESKIVSKNVNRDYYYNVPQSIKISTRNKLPVGQC